MLEATDDRDKVFALLGLADRTGLPPLMPSYTKPTSEIYSAAAKAMIAQESGLSVLSGVHGTRLQEGAIFSSLTSVLGSQYKERRTLPSWVPDWRLPRRTAYFHGFDWASGNHLYNINQGAPFRNLVPSNLGPDDTVLPLWSARIDTIVSIASSRPLLAHMATHPGSSGHQGTAAASESAGVWEKGLNKALFSLLGRLRLGLDYAQTGCGVFECLLKTLTADRGGVGEEGMGVWRTSTEMVWPSVARPCCQWTKMLGDHGAESDEDWAMESLVASAWTFLKGRSIFKTERGLVGIASEQVKVGDEVWDLVGGEVPFVVADARNERSYSWDKPD